MRPPFLVSTAFTALGAAAPFPPNNNVDEMSTASTLNSDEVTVPTTSFASVLPVNTFRPAYLLTLAGVCDICDDLPGDAQDECYEHCLKISVLSRPDTVPSLREVLGMANTTRKDLYQPSLFTAGPKVDDENHHRRDATANDDDSTPSSLDDHVNQLLQDIQDFSNVDKRIRTITSGGTFSTTGDSDQAIDEHLFNFLVDYNRWLVKPPEFLIEVLLHQISISPYHPSAWADRFRFVTHEDIHRRLFNTVQDLGITQRTAIWLQVSEQWEETYAEAFGPSGQNSLGVMKRKAKALLGWMVASTVLVARRVKVDCTPN